MQHETGDWLRQSERAQDNIEVQKTPGGSAYIPEGGVQRPLSSG